MRNKRRSNLRLHAKKTNFNLTRNRHLRYKLKSRAIQQRQRTRYLLAEEEERGM